MDKVVAIYYSIFEPVLTIGYAWILWRIGRSRANELRSSFFRFFIASGIASSMNIVMVHLQEYGRYFLKDVSFRDLGFNIMVFGSHSFSLSHTIGKTLVIASRFTAICYPLTGVWTTSRVKIAILLMFLTPALLYSFMVPLKAIYRKTSANSTALEQVYVGVEVWAQELSKVIAFTSYIVYILISVPMCAFSLYKMRLAQRFNIDLARQERALLFYSVVITLAHLVKSAQQASQIGINKMGRTDSDLLVHYCGYEQSITYLISNAFTTFVPPLLLLFTSNVVRNEATLGCLGRGRYHASILPYVSSTHKTTTDVPIPDNHPTPIPP